jgi:hypothetical protein
MNQGGRLNVKVKNKDDGKRGQLTQNGTQTQQSLQERGNGRGRQTNWPEKPTDSAGKWVRGMAGRCGREKVAVGKAEGPRKSCRGYIGGVNLLETVNDNCLAEFACSIC